MARCARCNKYMLLKSQTGYCNDCYNAVLLEEKKKSEEKERQRKAEEERRRKEEEARKAEEERRRKEEEDRKAEEERRRKEEEARKAEKERCRKEEEARKAEEERRRKEEEAKKAEEERCRKEEEARKAEEARKVEEERLRKEEEARKAEEERLRKEEEARKAEEESLQGDEETKHNESPKDRIINKEKRELLSLSSSEHTRSKLKRDSFSVGSIVCFGNYNQESDDNDPLSWIVISTKDGKALLLSKYVIQTTWYDYEPWTDYISTRWTSWSHSTIRSWLNEDFINAAFGEKERKAIMNTHIAAEQSRLSTMNPGTPCDDQIFILSVSEAKKLFKDDESRLCIPTYEGQFYQEGDEDKRIKAVRDRKASPWWLRDQGSSMCTSAFINQDGVINEWGIEADRYVLGIRPAMWVDIDLVVALSSKNQNSEKAALDKLDMENAIQESKNRNAERTFLSNQQTIKDRNAYIRQQQEGYSESNFTVGDTIQFGRYAQFSFDSHEEDLSWIVLGIHKGKALVVTESIIDYQPFISESYGATNWPDSEIRQWLNDEFFDQAFSVQEKKAITSSVIDDWDCCVFNDNDGHSTVQRVGTDESGIITEDHVFLLSMTETIRDPGYPPKLLSILDNASATPYAESKNKMSMYMPIHGWWLRTKALLPIHAVYAQCTGYEHFNAEYGEYEEAQHYSPGLKSMELGIRPAIWLDISEYRKLNGFEEEQDFTQIQSQEKPIEPFASTESQHPTSTTQQDLEKINSFFTKIVGVTYKNDDGSDRQRIIRDLARNGELEEGSELFLIPEPTNRFDPNCICVVAKNGSQLGNLSKEVAAEIAPQIKAGIICKAYVAAQTGGSVGYAYGVNIRIDQYRSPSAQSFSSLSGSSSYSSFDAQCDLEEALEYYSDHNADDAFPLFLKAAKAGNAEAQYYTGVCYDFGRGVSQDEEEAAKWYEKSAQQGYAQAQTDLAIDYREGTGVPVDYGKAIYWAKKAADQQHPGALIVLGNMYEHGLGVPMDLEESFELYERAADMDDPDGMSNVGMAYLIGRGVEQDLREAAKWNRRAAEKGQVKAQFNLAMQYARGDGVPVDDDEAAYWLREAASNGHPQAINILRNMSEY